MSMFDEKHVTLVATVVQAGAAVAQVILAYVLWKATSRYVNLTARYVDLTAALLDANRQQTEHTRSRDQAERRSDLVRIRELADRLLTAVKGLPQQLQGSGVDTRIRTIPLWSMDEVAELSQRSSNALPLTQGHCRQVVIDLSWLFDRIGDVRRTTRGQGFRYDTLDAKEWAARVSEAIDSLQRIDEEANGTLAALRGGAG